MTQRDVHERRVTIDSRGQKYTRLSIAERLWRRVDKSGGPDACWPYMGSRNSSGYGGLGGKDGSTHRAAHESENGPIPDGMSVCHRCDNPPCCNPAHLFLGTVLDNSRDMVSKGRSPDTRNERSGKAKLTNAQIEEIRERWGSGETLKSLAREFRVSSSYLTRVTQGTRRPIEGLGSLPTRSERVAVAAAEAAQERARVARQTVIKAAVKRRTLISERREGAYSPASRSAAPV